jgi:uncharacterized protein (DUF1015 family)
VTSPPYDVISPEEHRRLLDASPFNITHVTLGSQPGNASSYSERAGLLQKWIKDGVLVSESDPSFYLYSIEYPVPGHPQRRARFLGLIALGRLHPFSDGVVLPHERTFPKVVDDRLSLLEATRANLESIFLLYSDPGRKIDALLEARCRGEPAVRVEAKPGEFHALYPMCDVAAFIQLTDFFSFQRPIIADGHHRYTTSLRYFNERKEKKAVPGSEWQMMTFANLHGEGLSILATHRLVKLKGAIQGALESLLSRFEMAGGASPAPDLHIETREKKFAVRFPPQVRDGKRGAARTSYALLHDVVLGEWLSGQVDEEKGVSYFKEDTGENEALLRGEGDILFRMNPVERQEFQDVVRGGELFPHKTTYFYPKLWSGLVLWPLEEPERLALK